MTAEEKIIHNQPKDLPCGHSGIDWNGNGDCIRCARDNVLGMNKELLSHCHKAPIVTISADEGTAFWQCSECKQPCNVIADEDSKVHDFVGFGDDELRELDEILNNLGERHIMVEHGLEASKDAETERAVKRILDWHNKQVKELLDRLLEHGEDFTTFGDGSCSVAVEYIEAELANLKEKL